MQPDNLNVFDLDGTLIKVNSFKKVSMKLAAILLKKRKVVSLLRLTGWYLARKLNFIKHLKFKRRIVDIFEQELSEEEKRDIVQSVLHANINRDVFELMLKADNCIISTTSPFAFASRMPFKSKVVLISALDYNKSFPDIANFGAGKVENLKFYFKGKKVRISNAYTDSADDQALMDFSVNAFIVRNGCLIKVK